MTELEVARGMIDQGLTPITAAYALTDFGWVPVILYRYDLADAVAQERAADTAR